MHYLTLCCIVKDEDVFLKEWLAYHALIGVEHFYIYDNCSTVLVRELLAGFTDGTRVTIRRVSGERMQLPAYDDCLQSFGPHCRWMGFIDADEFALPMEDNDLRVALAEFEEYGGVAATWHLFGPSGHLKRPQGPVIRNYTEAFATQESYQIKCFVRPERTVQCLNPHYFRYAPGYFCVNEEHYPVPPRVQCTFTPGKRLRINHYFMKSQQDFEHKIQRGGGARTRSDAWHTMESFYDGAAKPVTRDEAILRFLPSLEAALAEDRLPPNPLALPHAGSAELLEAAYAFIETGKPEKALALLCPADPAHAETGRFWTLRAMAALALGQTRRAEAFIRQALVREPSAAAFRQLQQVASNRGRDDLARGIATILTRYSKYFS